MPLTLIRSDITTMQTDAIVNAANRHLRRGGGVCGAIFARADSDALQKACSRIGHCETGKAVITRGFGLAAHYIIHTVGPVWMGGMLRESEKLRSCYQSSLELAKNRHLRSIAFPLISSGIFAFPKQQAMEVALSAIGDWLLETESDMDVYLVLYDKDAYSIGKERYPSLQSFIDNQYVEEHSPIERRRLMQHFDVLHHVPPDETASEKAPATAQWEELDDAFPSSSSREDAPPLSPYSSNSIDTAYSSEFLDKPKKKPDNLNSLPLPHTVCNAAPRRLEDLLNEMEETFSEMLFRLIDQRGMSDPEVYKRANMDRRLFSKIRSNPNYQPTKSTVFALAIALQLNLDQTTDLLCRAGFAFSPSSKTDLIIKYFIREGIFNIHTVNEALFSYEQKLLGA